MKFTKEAWENAPEGARLEYLNLWGNWFPVRFIGFMSAGYAVVELQETARVATNAELRIILPKRKVTVQLWRVPSSGREYATIGKDPVDGWTLLGKHTFEIEGK